MAPGMARGSFCMGKFAYCGMKPFSVYVQLSPFEFGKLAVLRYYTSPTGKISSVIGGLLLLCALAVLTSLIPGDLGLGIPLLCMAFAFLVVGPLRLFLRAIGIYKGWSGLREGETYVFGEEGIALVDSRLSTVSWSAIKKKQRVGKFLYLFATRTKAFIIPMEQLTEEGVAFIAGKVPDGKL